MGKKFCDFIYWMIFYFLLSPNFIDISNGDLIIYVLFILKKGVITDNRSRFRKQYGHKRSNNCIKQLKKFKISTDILTQPAITCSKLIIETLEQGVKHVQN